MFVMCDIMCLLRAMAYAVNMVLESRLTRRTYLTRASQMRGHRLFFVTRKLNENKEMIQI